MRPPARTTNRKRILTEKEAKRQRRGKQSQLALADWLFLFPRAEWAPDLRSGEHFFSGFPESLKRLWPFNHLWRAGLHDVIMA